MLCLAEAFRSGIKERASKGQAKGVGDKENEIGAASTSSERANEQSVPQEASEITGGRSAVHK